MYQRVRNREWDSNKILQPPSIELNLQGTGFLLHNPRLKTITFNFRHHGIYRSVEWVSIARRLVKASPVLQEFTVKLGALGHSTILADKEIETTNYAFGVAGVMERVPIYCLLKYPVCEIWIWAKKGRYWHGVIEIRHTVPDRRHLWLDSALTCWSIWRIFRTVLASHSLYFCVEINR